MEPDPRRAHRAYLRAVEQTIRNLNRLSNTQARSALDLLGDVRRRILDELVTLPADGGTYRSTVLRDARAAVDRAATLWAQSYGLQLARGLGTAFDMGDVFVPKALEAASVQIHYQPQVDRALLSTVTQIGAELIVNVSNDIRRLVNHEIQLGVLGGKSVVEVQRGVSGILRTVPERRTRQMGPIANQALRIVRTEMMRAFNVADEARTREIARDVDGLRKYWRSARDARVRPTHLMADGRYAPGADPGPIALDDDFIVGGEKMGYPHDPRGSAKNVIHCRCVRILWKAEWFEGGR